MTHEPLDPLGGLALIERRHPHATFGAPTTRSASARRGTVLARLLIVVILWAAAPFATARAVPTNDTQWWQEVDLAGPLPDHLSYLVTGFSRFSDSDPNPALKGGGGFLTWTQGALGYTVGYLHADVRTPRNGDPLYADIPLVAVTGTVKSGVVTLSDRLRAEDLIGVPGNPWRFRNLVSLVASPRGGGPLKAIALSDEIFLDLSSDRLSRNRLLAGPVIAVTGRVDVAFQYVNERDIRGSPARIHGAFIDLAIRL